MAARDLLTVMLRILGFYFLVYAGAQIPGLIANYFAYPDHSRWWDSQIIALAMTLLNSQILTFVAAALLIILAPRIALRFYPYPESGEEPLATIQLTGGDLLRAGILVLGLYSFFLAFGPLVKVLHKLFLDQEPHKSFFEALGVDSSLGDSAFRLVAYLAAGLVFTFRGQALARWLEVKVLKAKEDEEGGKDVEDEVTE